MNGHHSPFTLLQYNLYKIQKTSEYIRLNKAPNYPRTIQFLLPQRSLDEKKTKSHVNTLNLLPHQIWLQLLSLYGIGR